MWLWADCFIELQIHAVCAESLAGPYNHVHNQVTQNPTFYFVIVISLNCVCLFIHIYLDLLLLDTRGVHMADTTTFPRSPPSNTIIKVVCTTLYPFSPKVHLNLSLDTLTLINKDAKVVSNSTNSICLYQTPFRIELQAWVQINLVESLVEVVKIQIMQRSYFVLTFGSKQGYKELLQINLLQFRMYKTYLHLRLLQFK